MQGPIYTELAPVQRRQRQLLVLRTAAAGLLAAGLAAIALELAGWWAGRPVGPWVTAAVLAAGPLTGALGGLWRRCPWERAAAAVDAHYRLKDRAATALAFLANPEPNAFHELQVLDARSHLRDIEPRRVVPLRLPRTVPYALLTAAAAVLLAYWHLGTNPVNASLPEPLPHILAVAEEIDKDLEALEKQVQQEPNEELARLVRQLREKLEELKQPGVSEREALAKISDMQQLVAEQQAQNDVALVDNHLEALGEAMQPAAALENAGKALQERKFDKAAAELEKVGDGPIDPKEAKAAQEKMEQAAKSMEEAKLGKLGEAARQMAKGLKGAKGQLEKGSRNLSQQVRQHQRRRRLNELLAMQQDRLSECKSQCQKTYQEWIQQKKKNQNSQSGGAGSAKAGNPLDEKTRLQTLRQLQEITGIASGDGPADVDQTRTSEESLDRAARQYREIYFKFQRMSEAVLNQEPIPLGHRQTIRTYFELIHPKNVTGVKEGGDGK